MRKFLLVLLLAPVLAFSQKTHTVGPKETLFSIGRLYKVHPRELASFNNIPYESGLTIGQVLKIPSKTTLPPLTEQPPAEKTVVVVAKPVEKVETKPIEKVEAKQLEKKSTPVKRTPVYHTVKKKENLYQISRQYNKVPVDDLKKWNKLNSDALREGMKLIVGYTGGGAAAVNTEKIENAPPPEIKPVEVPVKPKEEKIVNTPVQTKPVEVIEKPQVEMAPNADYKGGVFKSLYDAQTNDKQELTEEGLSGIFKTSSGWSDGKYYCLHNGLASGTVIKVTNKATGKSVYAKVLDAIPDIKMNEGLLLLISNSAASELGAGNGNFNCMINYSK